MSKCKICNREEELRLGTCFDCAEAESILAEGRDMYDEGNAKTTFEKLAMLIAKGWTPPIKKDTYELEFRGLPQLPTPEPDHD